MVELAYTADLKSAAERLVGSSPTGGTHTLGSYFLVNTGE